MNNIESKTNAIDDSIDLTSLRLRVERGETLDVMQEFVRIAGNPRFGAEHFLQTFSFALQESKSMDDFSWRTKISMSPHNIQFMSSQFETTDSNPLENNWISKYAGRSADQLGEFAQRRPDEAVDAAVVWVGAMNDLLASEDIALFDRHAIRNRSRKRLNFMKKRGQEVGSPDAIAAFIVLSNILGLPKSEDSE